MKLIALFASSGTVSAFTMPAWQVAPQLPAGASLSLLGVAGLLALTWYSERWRLEHRTVDAEPATLPSATELVPEQP